VVDLTRMRQTLKKQAEAKANTKPTMNLEAIKSELLQWLAELKLPPGIEATNWEELLQEFPSDPDDNRESGLAVRLALRLCTRENRYLISIMECLDPDSRGVGIVSAHVNWQAYERMIQKAIDESYRGQFDDLLRAKHTLWVQTFRPRELVEALNYCAMAILSNELTVEPDRNMEIEAIPHTQPTAPHFPKNIDEQG